jgi:hypothetical protein
MPLFNGLKVFGFINKVISLITDTFNRTTSGSLGTSSSGTSWVSSNGVWYCNGTSAQSNDAASTYPTAVVPFKSDVSLSLLTTNGTGVVFWQTGSGDWWATVPTESSSSENYNYCIPSSCCTGTPCTTGPDSCCGGTIGCVGGTPDSCCGGTIGCVGGSYNACCTGSSGSYTAPRGPEAYTDCDPCGSCITIPVGTGGVLRTYNCCVSNSCCGGNPAGCIGGTSNSCCGGNPAGCIGGSYSACCGGTNTCTYSACCSLGTASRTRYYWALNIVKKVSNVFSTVVSTSVSNSLTDSNPIAGITTVTSGESITAKAFSDTGLTTQLGADVTTTATGASRGNNVGVVKIPSTLNQGSTADSFRAE